MKLLFIIIYLAIVALFCAQEVASVACNQVLAPSGISASTYDASYTPAKANDNNFSNTSRWSAKGKGVYITYDLGSSKTVCSVRAAWLQANVRTYKYSVSVSTSSNSGYVTVKSGDSVIGPEAALQVYGFNQVSARYVRLIVNGNTVNDWAQLLELRVTGPGFVHPGVLVKQSQLNFVKAKIQANQQPWLRHYDNAKNSRLGKTSYGPSAQTTLTCGSGSYSNANPNNQNVINCNIAKDDGLAAWMQALLWIHSGDQKYANNAITIINAWVNKLTKINFNGANDNTKSNGPLQAAWMSSMYIKAAELLRHGKVNGVSSGWTTSAADKFGTWIMSVFYPHIRYGWYGGNNWDLTMLEGLLSIAVYNNNHTLFDSTINLWKSHVPQYIYLTSDGNKPKVVNGSSNVAASWSNPTQYIQGLAQETCRDLQHTQMGFASLTNFAETAWIQGSDAYETHANRLITGFEYNAHWLFRGSNSVPSNLCGGTLDQVVYYPTWEIFHNHFNKRVLKPLPNTTNVVNRIRNQGPYRNNHMAAYEVLTHHGVGFV